MPAWASNIYKFSPPGHPTIYEIMIWKICTKLIYICGARSHLPQIITILLCWHWCCNIMCCRLQSTRCQHDPCTLNLIGSRKWQWNSTHNHQQGSQVTSCTEYTAQLRTRVWFFQWSDWVSWWVVTDSNCLDNWNAACLSLYSSQD